MGYHAEVSRPLPFDHLICDLDGTLVDSAPGILAGLRAAVSAVLPDRAPEVARRIDRSLIGPPVHEMLARLLGKSAEQRDRTAGLEAALLAAFRAHYDAQGYRETRAFDGVHETLEALCDRGVTVLVLTNKPSAAAARVLAHCGLDRFVSASLCPDDEIAPFREKVDGAISLSRLHALRADRTALIGDSPDDRAAAEACGAEFFAVSYGYGQVSAAPGRTLSHFADLLSLAERVEARL
jgi:phosphoglycolate phosphatase